MHRLLLIVTLTATAAVPAAAQSAQPHTWWVAVGAGRGFFGTETAIGANVSVSYQFGASILSVRSTGTGDILESLFGSPGDIVGTSDWGVLYGRASTHGHLHRSLAVGIGTARVYRAVASGDPKASTHFGVPLEGQLFLRLGGVVGFGLYGYGNLNSDQSYGGLSAAIELGRLR